MTVRFYALRNGGFSLANYRRNDKPPDIHRDWPLIEDAVAAFAIALGRFREKKEKTGKSATGGDMPRISDLPIGSKIRVQSADPNDRLYAEWHGYWVESATTNGPMIMRRDFPSGLLAAGAPEPAQPQFKIEIISA